MFLRKYIFWEISQPRDSLKEYWENKFRKNRAKKGCEHIAKISEADFMTNYKNNRKQTVNRSQNPQWQKGQCLSKHQQ